jgi:hypothetical protein
MLARWGSAELPLALRQFVLKGRRAGPEPGDKDFPKEIFVK